MITKHDPELVGRVLDALYAGHATAVGQVVRVFSVIDALDAVRKWDAEHASAIENENIRLRFWLDVATSKGSIPDYSQDDDDRTWFGMACEFSNEHMPSSYNVRRLSEEYDEAFRAELEP